jgi:hypothetical protein
LRSVRFHLHHFMASGRSVDSPKRRSARAAFSENSDGSGHWRDILESDQGIMSAIYARDLFSVLFQRLEPIDQLILSALAEGFGVCDTAARLNISHQTVIRGLIRIAASAMKLGVVPPLASSHVRPRRTPRSLRT